MAIAGATGRNQNRKQRIGHAVVGMVDNGGQDSFVAKISRSNVVPGDFNRDGSIDLLDIDLMYDEMSAGTNGSEFDLTGDSVVDSDDITQWLTVAGTENGKVYHPGDANLDGEVGGMDFTTLAVNFGNLGADPDAASAYWRHGNFDGQLSNGDFEVGGTDFTAITLRIGHVAATDRSSRKENPCNHRQLSYMLRPDANEIRMRRMTFSRMTFPSCTNSNAVRLIKVALKTRLRWRSSLRAKPCPVQ